jgi:hypothetical protein
MTTCKLAEKLISALFLIVLCEVLAHVYPLFGGAGCHHPLHLWP